MLSYMANSGINSIMIYDLLKTTPDSVKIMDAAQARGIKVHICLVTPAKAVAADPTNATVWAEMMDIVRFWKDHPALLGWYIADDNGYANQIDMYNRIKAADPHHITSMTTSGVSDAVEHYYYPLGVDVMMTEMYYRWPFSPPYRPRPIAYIGTLSP